MKPKKFKLFHPEDVGQYSQLTIRNVENVNPLDYFAAQFIKSRIVAERDILVHQGFPLSEDLLEKTLRAKARLDWEENYRKLMSLEIPEDILNLLSGKKKSEQDHILKNSSLSNDGLVALILKAGKEGFLFSQFRIEKPQPDPKPPLSYQTKVFTAKFLDRKDEWLCFVTSYICAINTQSCYGSKPALYFGSNTSGLTRMGVLFDLQKDTFNSSVFKDIGFSGV
jgi:hypothetical protein